MATSTGILRIMDEFEFLDAQFRRLSEARALRAWDEKEEPLKEGTHSKFETAELMMAGVIRDYLKMRCNK